uniref:Uncharacterized protein n=1 Tax=Knipowitschia caucasica TaxID=637954 RepID=A0AAV2J301_KNICA
MLPYYISLFFFILKHPSLKVTRTQRLEREAKPTADITGDKVNTPHSTHCPWAPALPGPLRSPGPCAPWAPALPLPLWSLGPCGPCGPWDPVVPGPLRSLGPCRPWAPAVPGPLPSLGPCRPSAPAVYAQVTQAAQVHSLTLSAGSEDDQCFVSKYSGGSGRLPTPAQSRSRWGRRSVTSCRHRSRPLLTCP